MKTNLIGTLIITLIVSSCNYTSQSHNKVNNANVDLAEDSIKPDIESDNTNDITVDSINSQKETEIAEDGSLLPFFKNGVGYYIEKDSAITHRLFGNYKSPSIPFNTRVEVEDVFDSAIINGQKFFWVSLKGIEGKYPSFFFSTFKFPYTKEGYSMPDPNNINDPGRTGTNITPTSTVSDLTGWFIDSLGWQSSKEFINLSDIDGESGWLEHGIRINADSLSFNAAVQLYFHAAYL